MISEEQLIAYLSGQIRGPDRDRFERELANDLVALRQLVEQEKMDASLSMLVAQPDRQQVKDSILAIVEGPAEVGVKSKIYERVEYETKRKSARDRGSKPGLFDWFKRLPVGIQLASLGAFALLCFFLGKPAGGGEQYAKNTSGKPGKPQPISRDKHPVSREASKWPFAADSPWNAPIGSSARFVEPVGAQLEAGIVFYNAQTAHPTFKADANANPTQMLLYRANTPQPIARLHVPKGEIPNSSKNFAIVAEDGKTIYDIRGGQRNGNDIIANNVVVADLTGSGMPGQYDAPTSTGFSDYAGSLCADDFQGPIRRALGAVVDPSALAWLPDGNAHVWPASKTPGSLRQASVRNVGNLHIGTLLAIPPEVDVASIGVGSSGPAYEIARAFRDYGLYLKKPLSGMQSRVTPGVKAPFGMCGDLSSVNLPPDFDQQLARVASYLKVVENNGPGSVGGGGTPARPAAPKFDR